VGRAGPDGRPPSSPQAPPPGRAPPLPSPSRPRPSWSPGRAPPLPSPSWSPGQGLAPQLHSSRLRCDPRVPYHVLDPPAPTPQPSPPPEEIRPPLPSQPRPQGTRVPPVAPGQPDPSPRQPFTPRDPSNPKTFHPPPTPTPSGWWAWPVSGRHGDMGPPQCACPSRSAGAGAGKGAGRGFADPEALHRVGRGTPQRASSCGEEARAPAENVTSLPAAVTCCCSEACSGVDGLTVDGGVQTKEEREGCQCPAPRGEEMAGPEARPGWHLRGASARQPRVLMLGVLSAPFLGLVDPD
jgi:hypothetical protein